MCKRKHHSVLFSFFVGVIALASTTPSTHGWLTTTLTKSLLWRPTTSTSSLYQSKTSAEDMTASAGTDIEQVAVQLMTAFAEDPFFQKDYTKACHVKIGASPDCRLGLFATQRIRKGDVILGIPYNEQYQLRGDGITTGALRDILPEAYESWTGSMGTIALQLLQWIANAANSDKDDFLTTWVQSLPTPEELQLSHPLLWSEEGQELLQGSSTRKIYRQLDDIEEDAQWLVDNVFSKNTAKFPTEVTWKSKNVLVPCFSVEGFRWAMALAQSRSFFLDGTLRLLPLLDYCNHADAGTVEIRSGSMGTLWGSVKSAQLVADRDYEAGEEVFCSYGPKSAAEYLMEYGFVPDACWETAVSELTFEIDPEDRFHDDKLDILEFETYDLAPMDPSQSFDVVYAPGQVDNGGEPDPAMLQFVRLCQLTGQDAFLLESIFRKDVWGFMELPVSEMNEVKVVKAILSTCQKAMNEFAECDSSDATDKAKLCSRLRESESTALRRLIEYLEREQEALDLKEYYQERRLKDLGLDSVWSPEDDLDGDLSYGQARVPGGADYDW